MLPIFLIRVSEDEINIAKNFQNLRLECGQSNRYRTPPTSTCMESLTFFFDKIVIE